MTYFVVVHCYVLCFKHVLIDINFSFFLLFFQSLNCVCCRISMAIPHLILSPLVWFSNLVIWVIYLSFSIQLRERKFPKFSGIFTEWQEFEYLINSILSHALDLSYVMKFEYFRTSLGGEALYSLSYSMSWILIYYWTHLTTWVPWKFSNPERVINAIWMYSLPILSNEVSRKIHWPTLHQNAA